MANWKNNYDPALIADLIESIKKTTNDGNITFEGFAFSEYMVVLPSMVNWNSNIPDIEKNRIIRSAIFKSGDNGEISTESLISHISRLEREYVMRSPKKFKLITGISISKTCELPHTRFDGSTIVLNPKINNKIRSERNKIISEAIKSFSASLPQNYSQISVSINARSQAEAADLALDRLDFIRGLWNLSKNRSNTFRMSFGKRKPINSIVLFPIHTLHKPKGELNADSYWWEPQYQGEVKKFTKQSELNKMHSYMKDFRSKLNNCNYKYKIVSALVRYVRALDSLHWENSFLQMWGILESLTNTTGGSYKKTVDRASYLYSDRKLSQEILLHLKDYRNRSVHAGKESGEIEALLFQLKNHVEELIVFLVFNNFNFKSIKDASEFLDLPDDKSVLTEQIRKREFAKSFTS